MDYLIAPKENLTNISFTVAAAKQYSRIDRFKPLGNSKYVRYAPIVKSIDYTSEMQCKRRIDESICKDSTGYSFGKGSIDTQFKQHY